MARIYKIGEKSIYITSESIPHSLFKDALTCSMILLLSYFNYNYLGNSWYIGLFIVLIIIGFTARIFKKEITKEELLEELEIKRYWF